MKQPVLRLEYIDHMIEDTCSKNSLINQDKKTSMF